EAYLKRLSPARPRLGPWQRLGEPWYSRPRVFFFQAEDGIRDFHVTGVQTCALPIFTFPRRAGRIEIEDARASLMRNNILATPDNVRAVRQVIMEEAALGMWQDIVANPDFYTLPGARDLLFAMDEPAFNLQEIQHMLNEAGLEFLGFVDLDP